LRRPQPLLAFSLLPAVSVLALGACGGAQSASSTPSPSPTPCPVPSSAYATRVVDSWIPACSLAQNAYNDPEKALGRPDAGGSRAAGYTGFVSLGFGGHVTLDLGGCVADQPGNDLRVYQAVSSEPVTVYVAASPQGPFTLLRPFLQSCGGTSWVPGERQRGYCDFDLASASVAMMRYVRVEDGEMYPCPGDTNSEGADLDAIQALAVSSAVGAGEPEPGRRVY